MSKEKKAKIIDSLEETFSRCSVGILTDYRGLSVHEMTSLRRRLGESGIEYRVVKNTLARFAAERLGRTERAVLSRACKVGVPRPKGFYQRKVEPVWEIENIKVMQEATSHRPRSS